MLTLYFKDHMHTALRFFVGCALHNGVSRKNSNALAPRTGRLLQTLFLQGFLFEVSLDVLQQAAINAPRLFPSYDI